MLARGFAGGIIETRISRWPMSLIGGMKLNPRILLLASAIAVLAMIAPGADAPGVHVWKLSEIEAGGKALSAKIDAHKVASETIAKDGNTTFMIAHREGSGQAEWHAIQADVIVISQGEVSMTVGGTMVNGKDTAPGEMRGDSITGGMTTKLVPGDVVYIPPKTPHLMTLEPGKQVTYFVTKVTK
jgi:mannose-6-phosphate isomerase-like protein (cupin superfamily)